MVTGNVNSGKPAKTGDESWMVALSSLGSSGKGAASRKTRVAINCAAPVVTLGVRAILSKDPTLVLLDNGDPVNTPFDVLVTDLASQKRLSACRVPDSRYPTLGVVVLANSREMLTWHTSPSPRVRVVVHDACTADELFGSVKEVCGDAERKVIRAPRHVETGQLTRMQREVFMMLVGGLSVGDIALRFGLSKKTISCHKVKLQQRLGVSSTAELAMYALRKPRQIIK